MIDAMKQALAKFERLWEIGIDVEYKVDLLPEIRILRQAIEQAEKQEPTKLFGPNLEQILNAAGFYKRDAVCCGDYKKCIEPCTPKGEWLAKQELAKPEQAEYDNLSVKFGERAKEYLEGAKKKWDHEPWCDSLNIMLTSLPPQKAKCNCKQAQPEQAEKQEPVAWVDKVWVERLDISKQLRMELLFSRCQLNNNQIPLYAASPKPIWVGLTDVEVGKYSDRLNGGDIAREVEAKLKEKNNG